MSTVGTFLDEVSIPAPLVLSPDDKLLTAGLMLSHYRASMVVISRQREILGALYGYQLLFLFSQIDKNHIYKTLFQTIRESAKILAPESIPTVRLGSSLSEILQEIVERRFGDVLVTDDEAQPIGMAGLHELMQACGVTLERTNIQVGTVASPAKIVDDSMTSGELIKFLFRNRIRRVVVKRTDGLHCADERSLLKYFFSLRGLQSIKDEVDDYLNSPIKGFANEETRLMTEIRGTRDVSDAWKLALSSGQDSLIVDGEKIATPWDLVVKPFIQGRLNPRTLH